MTGDKGAYTPLAPAACTDPADGQSTIATSGREMIVVNKVAGKVQFFAVGSFDKLGELEMAKLPHEVVIAPDRKTAYVSIYGLGVFGKNSESPGRQVAIIDLATRAQIGAIDVSPYKGPHGMAFDGQGVLWVSCDVSGVILAIDVGARRILDAITTDSFGTHWLVVTPDGKKLYASNKTFPFAVVIDTVKRTLLAKIALERGSEGLALSPDGARLYVMAQRPQSFYVIDTQSDEVVATVPLEVFEQTPAEKNPQKRVKVAPDGKHLLITSFNTGEIAIAPVADLGAQTRVAAEKGPMGITFADANRAYVMNHDQGSISVVDLPTRSVVGKFSTAPGPETMALFG
jgi:YVTN family beta-propeller protein